MNNKKGYIGFLAVVGLLAIGAIAGAMATFVGHLNSDHPHVVTASK